MSQVQVRWVCTKNQVSHRVSTVHMGTILPQSFIGSL